MNARPPLCWSLDWKSALFTAVLLPLLLSLGTWQLQRADEKRAIQQQQARLAATAPLAVTGQETPEAYQPLQVDGRFDVQRYFLLDNRTRQGRTGFEVIGLFRAEAGGPWIAVNRGWVAGSPDRRQLPVVAFPPAVLRVHGHAYWPQAGWRPAGPAVADGDWPRISQSTLVADLAAALGEPMAPYLVRLAPDSPAALVTDWQPVNTQPEKHVAYAVQWFLMALALAVLFVFRNSNLLAWMARTPTDPEAPR